MGKTITYTTEQLTKYQCVNTCERTITSKEIVEFQCYKCEATGTRKWTDALKAYKLYGFTYQCPNCLKEKYTLRSTNNPEWLAKVRAAAQTNDHKARARANGKKKTIYTPQEIIRVIQESGAISYEGDLSKTSKNLLITWPDGSSRNIRINRFMLDGCLTKPQTGSLNPNTLRYQKKIKRLGLQVEIISPKLAKITYKAVTWQQRWTNCVDKKCQRMIKKIDVGYKIQELMDTGLSLNNACLKVGVAPVTYYRRRKLGLNPVESSISIRNYEQSIVIPGAIYNKEVFKDVGVFIRPDIYLPEHKLVIEIDGMRTHNEKWKSLDYHNKRFHFYQKQGLRLLAFTEKEVTEHLDIVMSLINHKIGKTLNTVGARQCEVREVTTKEAGDFFAANHLKGKGQGKCFGLYYQEQLVAALRYANHPEYLNISRFACKINWSVTGAYSKLLKLLPNKKIINFVDARHGSGQHLLNYGFKLVHEHIGFEWTDEYNSFNRLSFLGNTGYDYGLVKFHDYGQLKYVRETPQCCS